MHFTIESYDPEHPPDAQLTQPHTCGPPPHPGKSTLALSIQEEVRNHIRAGLSNSLIVSAVRQKYGHDRDGSKKVETHRRLEKARVAVRQMDHPGVNLDV